ncbi:MAG: DNA-directed RNA polymerase subunit K [Candidatus Thermoplasmatota archaeon]|nr:DNA-directed RNA polymerase subunit K [Candidatus Thermoplasmatota archaeon]
MTFTRFEKARIIGARALQLSMGAPPILASLPKDLIDPVEIAMMEYEQDVIPITVRQKKTQTER